MGGRSHSVEMRLGRRGGCVVSLSHSGEHPRVSSQLAVLVRRALGSTPQETVSKGTSLCPVRWRVAHRHFSSLLYGALGVVTVS